MIRFSFYKDHIEHIVKNSVEGAIWILVSSVRRTSLQSKQGMIVVWLTVEYQRSGHVGKIF